MHISLGLGQIFGSCTENSIKVCFYRSFLQYYCFALSSHLSFLSQQLIRISVRLSEVLLFSFSTQSIIKAIREDSQKNYDLCANQWNRVFVTYQYDSPHIHTSVAVKPKCLVWCNYSFSAVVVYYSVAQQWLDNCTQHNMGIVYTWHTYLRWTF